VQNEKKEKLEKKEKEEMLQKEEIRQLAVEKMEVYMYTSIHIYIMGPN
jgi:hypothetical protein